MALGFHSAGKVALGKVRQFVGQNAGELVHRGGLRIGAEVDADDPPRGRKGVDGLGVYEHELQLRLL